MKHLFLPAFLLFFVTGCGNSTNNNKNSAKTLSEVSEYCSSNFISEINSAEIPLIMYKKNGLIFGQELTEAHQGYQAIIKKYDRISCKATEQDSGEVKTITTEMVNDWIKSIFDLLYNAHFVKCKNPSALESYENKGCVSIRKYMKTNFGYN